MSRADTCRQEAGSARVPRFCVPPVGGRLVEGPSDEGRSCEGPSGGAAGQAGAGFSAGALLTLPDEVAHHGGRVLRLRDGQTVELFDGCGHSARGVWRAGGRQAGAARASVEVTAVLPHEPPPRRGLRLVQCLCAAERMDWCVEKAVELGAEVVQPVRSARCSVRLDDDRAARRREHWQRIAVSAATQCGSARVARVLPVGRLDDAAQPRVDSDEAAGVNGPRSLQRLVLDPQASLSITEWARGPGLEGDGDIALVCGPESGLTPDEVSALVAGGHHRVSLGPRVLRAETAGPAALAVLQALLGDWSSST